MLKGNNLKDLRILITGVAGFIGSNIAEELLKKGAIVTGIDNLYTGSIENIKEIIENPNFKFIKADIRNINDIFEATRDINVIFHEAAQTSVPESIEKPDFCNEVNVVGSLNILNCARRNNVDKVVFASSAAIYGDDPRLPKKEDMYAQPKSPYGVSKLSAEAYMIAFNQTYGMNTTCLRYFNVYGPKQRNSPYSGVLSIFISKIFNNENLVIFGDGTQTRDYVYVKDVVKANVLSIERKKSMGKVINIGTGIQIDLNTVAKLLQKLCNKTELKILYNEKRGGDIQNSVADIGLAKEVLGYKPEYDVEKGLKEYIDFYKKFLR